MTQSTEYERAGWSKSFEGYWEHGKVKAYKIRDTYGYTKNVWRKAWLAFEEQAARRAQVVPVQYVPVTASIGTTKRAQED